MVKEKKVYSIEQPEELLEVLQARFEKNTHRHEAVEWTDVQAKLENNLAKMKALVEMENTAGEPDVVNLGGHAELVFVDCAKESPKGRRSICYDQAALEARKKHKPENSAANMAAEMGIEILTEAEYRALQELEEFDLKTSTWIKTPDKIRQLGGALYCDRRYDTVFVYHNGAESYYGSRGFRGLLKI